MRNKREYIRHAVVLILVVAGVIICTAPSLSSSGLASAQATAPSWSFTGSLNAPRSGHTATLLPNGKVLVAGGGAVEAELYDPASGTWSVTGSLNAARSFHTATLLPNGNVLVAGGSVDQTPFSISNRGAIRRGDRDVEADGQSQCGPRISHGDTAPKRQSLGRRGGGKVFDGVFPIVNSAELYDPATETWSSAGALNVQRYLHTATLLPDGKVLVAAGCFDGDCDLPLKRAELYDPNTGAWSGAGDANALRETHTATLLPDGNVLVAGGGRQFANLHTNELYNPATGTWTFTGSLTRHTHHTATLLRSGKVLVAGGQTFDGVFQIVNSAELYDPATGDWSSTASLKAPRSSHTATLLQNGKVLVVGGWDGTNNGPLQSAELYDSGSSSTINPIDDPQFFVRQHYLDFLGREPDPAGLAFWTNEIIACGADAQCVEVKRVNVSAAFFLSIEFQETGYLVYRMYKAAYGDMPGAPVPLTRQEFLPDTQHGQGVVVGVSGWEQALENHKNSFANEFVTRTRFTTEFPPTMISEQFVDALNVNAGGVLSQGERDQLVSELASGAKTRAQILRSVAQDADLARNEFNKAFVLMQYFGYLRRNPNDLTDTNFAGYNFWLDKLNQFNGNFVAAEMVRSFISSIEYRQRFGQP